MKEIRVYDFIQQLRKKGVWVGISGSCEWWNTRADYETIYNYILTHHPERKYGYLSETANSLSNKRLGGGVNTFWIEKTSKTRCAQWKKLSTSEPHSLNFRNAELFGGNSCNGYQPTAKGCLCWIAFVVLAALAGYIYEKFI